MTRALLVAALLAMAVPAARAEDADRPTDPAALDHYWKAIKLLDTGDRIGAIQELRLGFAVQPWPTFLFLIGKIADEAKDCATALPALRDYLVLEPASERREAADAIIDRCTPDPPPPPAPPPERPMYVESPWYRDVLGGALVGSGVATLGVGVGFYFASRSSLADATRDGNTLADYNEALDTARSRRAISIVGMSVGGALIVGGVLRYALRGNKLIPVQRIDASVAPDRVLLQVSSWF